jgi:hypothetical protein
MSDIRNQIFQAIEKHEESKNIETHFNYLTQLQKEQAPWLNSDLIEISVMQSFAKYYNDVEVDFLICKYMENSFSEVLEKVAA